MTPISTLFLVLVLVVLFPITAAHNCPSYTADIVKHVSASPKSLTPHITSFLTNLGSANTGRASFPSGYRHLNWDDGAGFSSDGNFSNHGITLHSKLSKILHSNAPDTADDRFSTTIRSVLSRSFKRYSHPRLITPAKSNKLRATFTIPGTTTRAGVSAFGAIFVDVDETRRTWLWLKDSEQCTIARVEVPVMANGLTFVGVSVGDGKRPIIAEVMLKLGSATIADFRKRQPCLDFTGDLVVLDDMFFAEPKKMIPPRR